LPTIEHPVTGVSDADGFVKLKYTYPQLCPYYTYGAKVLDITGDDIVFDEDNLNFFNTIWGGPSCAMAEESSR